VNLNSHSYFGGTHSNMALTTNPNGLEMAKSPYPFRVAAQVRLNLLLNHQKAPRQCQPARIAQFCKIRRNENQAT
jgi:hypothetical protein